MRHVLILTTALLASCTSNMVLYQDDISGYTLGSGELPDTAQCAIIETEFKSGKTVYIKEGTRWIDPSRPNSYLYKCPLGDTSCKTKIGKVTKLSESQKYLLEHCRRAAQEDGKNIDSSGNKPTENVNKEVKPQSIDSDTKRALAVDNLIKILYEKNIIKHEFEQQLYLNFNFFMRMLVSEADITDLIGTVITGTIRPLKEPIYSQKYHYQVQQVLDDMVILECGKCSLPPIGIKRIDERPSPLEGQIFNDTRAVYKFIGTQHYKTLLHERRQIVMFERIPVRSLGLPSNYLHEILPGSSM